MLPETIPSFIVLLGILIFVHEFGHFIVAKKLGIGVLRFSLGFGPILWRRQWGETEYVLSAFPLGGYVKLYGEETAPEGEPLDVARSFSSRPVAHRIAVVLAGPVMNLVLGFFLFLGLAFFGEQYREPVVGDVTADMPASHAGIRPGDRVVEVDGVSIETWDRMAELIRDSGGREIALKLLRDGQRLDARIKPVLHGEGDKARPVVGIVWGGQVGTLTTPWVEAPLVGAKKTWEVVGMTLEVVGKLLTGRGNKDDVGGPIAIADMAGKALRAGVLEFFLLMAVLSVNLAVLNILPIPVLDGGLLLFFAIEAVLGRPVNQRVREIAQQTGMILLLTLIVYMLYNDTMRIIIG